MELRGFEPLTFCTPCSMVSSLTVLHCVWLPQIRAQP